MPLTPPSSPGKSASTFAHAPAGGGRPGVGIRPSWEPWAAGLLVILAIAFGGLVLKRSAYSERRRTDAGVFFRAGYAVRAGVNPYTIPDDNEWYFLYPPGIAAFFVPLADPPACAAMPNDSLPASTARDVSREPSSGGGGAPATNPSVPPARAGFIPYPVSIVLWYALSVICAALTIELLARTLSRGSPDPHIRALTPASGGWWSLRLWPLFMVMPDLLSTLSRGQISTLVLACISAGIYALSRGRKFSGALAISAAACIKVIPGLLLFDVLTRRGTRAILGCIVCGLAMMVLLPVLVYDPIRAYEYTHLWTDRVLLAGIHTSAERLQAGTDFADTDNLSIQGSLHNLTNIATPRGQRPAEPEPWIKATHLILSLALLGATLLIGPLPWCRPRVADTALQIMLRLGMLCCVMVLASPMSHRHYFVLTLPALAALVSINLTRSPLAVPCGWGIVLVPAYIVLQALPRSVDSGPLRDLPIPPVLTIIVWAMCAAQLVKAASQASQPAATIAE